MFIEKQILYAEYFMRKIFIVNRLYFDDDN